MEAVSPSNLMISPTRRSQPTLTSSYIFDPDIFSATTTAWLAAVEALTRAGDLVNLSELAFG